MKKIETNDYAQKGVRELQDVPSLASGEMQRKFDELSVDVVIPAHNRLIDELAASTAASQLGSTGGTVQSELSEIRSAVALKADSSAVLERGNSAVFLPTGDYNPATKKYVDDTLIKIGAGDMQRAVYDIDGSGAVENAKRLGGVLPAGYAAASHNHDPADLASPVTIAKGGTGATTAEGARANLGMLQMKVVSDAAGAEPNTVYFVYDGAATVVS